MHPVSFVTTKQGRRVRQRDAGGAVFVPSPTHSVVQPVYLYGPNPQAKDAVFTCPVSAIPSVVWDLMELWWSCRMMNTLPYPDRGVFQPLIVRRAFVMFETEQRRLERTRSGPDSREHAPSAGMQMKRGPHA